MDRSLRFSRTGWQWLVFSAAAALVCGVVFGGGARPGFAALSFIASAGFALTAICRRSRSARRNVANANGDAARATTAFFEARVWYEIDSHRDFLHALRQRAQAGDLGAGRNGSVR